MWKMIAGFMTGFSVMLAAWIFIRLIFQQRNEYKASWEN
jgi:hypothetical protein